MKLKKQFIQIPFSPNKVFNFVYEEDEDLKSGIMELVKCLKINKLIIQSFSNLDLTGLNQNEVFKGGRVIRHGNFHYYLEDNLNFLKPIHLCAIRFMKIFSCDFDDFNQTDISTKDFIRMINRSSLIISLDNYLEVSELQVNMDKFGGMIQNFLV